MLSNIDRVTWLLSKQLVTLLLCTYCDSCDSMAVKILTVLLPKYVVQANVFFFQLL